MAEVDPKMTRRQDAAEGSREWHPLKLSAGECLMVALVAVLFILFVPQVWRRIEPFSPPMNGRIPYALSEDYWTFRRTCEWATKTHASLVLGDSVIWGEYVEPSQTLSSHLSQLTGHPFLNLGVNGIHPAAMAGLIDYYGSALQHRTVILHFNPLWMSSPRHDLSTDKEFQFNHPKLVPQFSPKIPCYRASAINRLSICLQSHFEFPAWLSHWSIAYHGGLGLADWILEHPYGNPLGLKLAAADEPASQRHRLVSWTEQGTSQSPFDWVEPQKSIQWQLFKKTLLLLLARKDRVFVVVGPFNEHMIADQGLERYRQAMSEIRSWLEEKEVPHWMPDALSSELYADASHPMDEGYSRLAQSLLSQPEFQDFLEETER